MKRKRLFRVLYMLACLAIAVAPCFGSGTTDTGAGANPAAKSGDLEAPELVALVAAGKLPPLKERLPEEPMVVAPYEKIGKYGGELRLYVTRDWQVMDNLVLSYPTLLRYDLKGEKILPNIAKDYQVLDGGRTFRFTLRKGHKWSDGHPFTADDVEFFWKEILNNKSLTPTLETFWREGTQPAAFTKIDALTFQFTFQKPQGFFLDYLAGEHGELFAPKHYLQQWHPGSVGEQKANESAVNLGYKSWVQLMSRMTNREDHTSCPGLPTLRAWVDQTTPPADRYFAERNPYFFAVDTQGHQLPYINRLVMHPNVDLEVLNLNIVQGKADFQIWGTSFSNYTLYKENEKAGYRTLLYANDVATEFGLEINITHTADPILGDILRDVRFRRALSLAINREQINEMLYHGMGSPRAATVMPVSPYYKPEWERAWATFEVAKANALLDEMGLKWDANHQYRLRKDGKPVALTGNYVIDFASAEDTLAIVKKNWAELGVKLDWVLTDRAVFQNRIYSGEAEISVWPTNGAINDYKVARWAPYRRNCWWASLHGLWYESSGKQGLPMSGDVKRLMEIYDQLVVTTDPATKKELFQKLYQLHSDNVWIIGIVGGLGMPIIVNNRLRNVPRDSFYAWLTGLYVGHKLPIQFYYE